jgi:hypothetical protein
MGLLPEGLKWKVKTTTASWAGSWKRSYNPCPMERELWGAIQRFVDSEIQAGGSRERAFNILRSLLRKARDFEAQQRRATFQVVK